jgi:hypothetical protein
MSLNHAAAVYYGNAVARLEHTVLLVIVLLHFQLDRNILSTYVVTTATARQIYGSIYLQRKQHLTSRSINPCSKGKIFY